jgi:hypothetical protein
MVFSLAALKPVPHRGPGGNVILAEAAVPITWMLAGMESGPAAVTGWPAKGSAQLTA